ncbi:MAG: hypothetical protein LIO75_02560 [Lachnospiraceae bacterium]|nr:hypothetical protein [Lachnospiraceae bacterium]
MKKQYAAPQTEVNHADKSSGIENDELKYEYWMASLYKISDNRRRQACLLAGGARQLYRLSPEKLKGLHFFTEGEIKGLVSSRQAFDIEGE